MNNYSYLDYSIKLDCLEKQVSSQPVTQSLYLQIIYELDSVQNGLRNHQNSDFCDHLITPELIEKLDNKCLSLYVKADTAFHQHLIHCIKRQTNLLKQSIQKKSDFQIFQIANSLGDQIDELFSIYCPSFSERRILVQAKWMIEFAKLILQKPLEKVFINQAILEDEQFQKAEELLEIMADYLGNDDIDNLCDLWKSLCYEQKKLIEAYLDGEDPLISFLHEIERSTYQNVHILG